MVLHPPAIPVHWVDSGETWSAIPNAELFVGTELEPWHWRFVIHRLRPDQLREIGLDETKPYVVRWGHDEDGWPRRGIICASSNLDEASDLAADYLQTAIARWRNDEPARQERIAAWARAWVEANEPDGV